MSVNHLQDMILRDLLRRWCRVAPRKADPAMLPEDGGWNLLLEAAVREGVTGLVLQGIQVDPAGSLVPEAVVLELKKHSSGQAAVGAWLQAVLEEVLELFNGQGIIPMVVRGQAMVEQLYDGNTSLRGYIDHDLVVSHDRIKDARTCLAEAGFHRVATGTDTWERDGALIDLHHDPYDRERVPSRSQVLHGEAGAVLKRATPGLLCGRQVLFPDRYDLILMLSTHVVKHSFDRLIRLVDIGELWQQSPLDTDRLLAQAESEGSRDALYYALAATQARLDPGIPQAFLEALRPVPRLWLDRLFTSVLQGKQAPYFAEWLLLAQLDGTIARIRAMGEICLTPEESAASTSSSSLGKAATITRRLFRHAGRALGTFLVFDQDR